MPNRSAHDGATSPAFTSGSGRDDLCAVLGDACVQVLDFKHVCSSSWENEIFYRAPNSVRPVRYSDGP